tara:strand:- start:1207 stop:2040 length:834 start_codon:yes stop_codon:yes gene_type:complete
MNIETNKQISNEIQAYQLKQYTILEKIQEQLLDNNKYLNENTPYLNKLFYNELTNFTSYVNEYGFLITFTDKEDTNTIDNSCPTDALRQGNELYAYTREGSEIASAPMCNIYGNNIQNADTKDMAWVDIEGYKHEYTHNSWKSRDASCKSPILTLTHKQYSSIPTGNYSMNKERQCIKNTVNPALIYELQRVNKDFILFLKSIKGDKDTNDKIHKMITSLEKQNLYIVQEMNKDQSVDAMLQDSVVKKDMYQYQFISWSLVTVLAIGLIGHFGKKKL